ncbi:tyrosine-type recombinase/integrase [Clostridium celatum]|uniref:tyrosine-type recombinase/integrase n=1 Tax=Clostridium celatum TaxID=36834 RepID=UPI0018976E8E|nr:tyrosine-type recombinase/integrase [Clostridium celatum]MDU6297469.1 tyrosine-type recombinase/integrase [Clostridium celatum]
MLDEEMLEMMKFYEFYKKMRASEVNSELTSNFTEDSIKTEGAIKNNNNASKKVEVEVESNNNNNKEENKKKNYKATRPLEVEEYEQIIKLCKEGFSYYDKKTGRSRKFRPNPSLAFALALQATLGFRASDIVNLKVSDFNRSKFSIKEIKTGKWQNRELNDAMYNKLLEYAINNNLDKDDFIYPNKVRNMQQQLKIITDYLGYKNIGTHSFRKLFAHTLYEESGHDIELVRHVLNHSDIKTTMRYLGVSMKRLKEMSNKIDFSYAL